MRYTKAALLIFGLGLVTGLVVVVGEFSEWDYLASGIMALGLVLLPLGLFADGRGIAALRWIARRFSRPKRGAKQAVRAGPARASARPRRGPPRSARRAALADRAFSAQFEFRLVNPGAGGGDHEREGDRASPNAVHLVG